MSGTTTPQTPLQQIISVLQKQLSFASNEEIIALGPPVVTFLTWVQQNPGAAVNPIAVLPQIVALEANLLAAQANATDAIIQEIAGQLVTALNNAITAAKTHMTPPG